MKTKEFIEKVEKLGYNIEINWPTIYIKCDGCILARVDKARAYTIDTKAAFEVKNAEELFDLCVKYAKTPIEDREEKKKYYIYLKNKNREFYESIYSYLTLRKQDNTFSLDVGVETAGLTAQFTQKEIDAIKEKYSTDLEEFKQIPIEEIEAE